MTLAKPTATKTAPIPATSEVQTTQENLLEGIQISVDIPKEATLAQVEETIGIGIERYKELQAAQEQLGPILGRLFAAVQERVLFRPDFKNFTAWLMERVVKGMGVSKSTCFDWLKVARAFPDLDATQYKALGATRLLIASAISDDEVKAAYPELDPDVAMDTLLEESKGMTTDDFKDRVDSIRKVSSNRPKPFIVSVRTNEQTYNRWNALVLANPNVTVAEVFQQVMDFYYAANSIPEPVPATPATEEKPAEPVASNPITKAPQAEAILPGTELSQTAQSPAVRRRQRAR